MTIIEKIRFIFKKTTPQSSSRVKIYFDMDGVLAKWSWVGPDTWMEQEGYFANRPLDTAIAEAAKILSKDDEVEVFIASKFVKDRHKAEKNEFCDKHVRRIFDAQHRIFIPYDDDKSSAIDFTGAILVDDWNDNLFDCEKQGGLAVKYLNGENNSSGKWKGLTIAHTSDGATIAKALKAFAKTAA